MASDASFVQYVVDQVNGAGAITTRFMFGEYALYCNEKVVGLICDNKLFVKPTDGGRAYIGTPVEAPAYTGAKPSFLIEDKLEDRAWLTELIRITEREVALPAKTGKEKGVAKPPVPNAAAAKKGKTGTSKNTKKAATAGKKARPAKPAKKKSKKPSPKPTKRAGSKIVKSTAKKTARTKKSSRKK